jgi:hypothetical protein
MKKGFSRRGAIGLMGGAAFAATARAAMAQQPFEQEALSWARAQAKPLDTHDPSLAELRPLVSTFGEAQVIGLGDATGGGGHEELMLKAALVRALIAYGGVGRWRWKPIAAPPTSSIAMSAAGGDLIELLRQPGFPQNWQTEDFSA